MLVHVQYAVFERPRDYPGGFIARKFFVTAGVSQPGPVVGTGTTLEAVRKCLPVGFHRIGAGELGEGDPQFLVETWIGEEEMDENPIEAVLDQFDEEMKQRGVPGDGTVLYFRQYDIVVVALKEAMALLEKDGLSVIVEWAIQETLRRGINVHPLEGCYLIDTVATFAHPKIVGVEREEKITVILTYNRVHKKTQVLVGLEDEGKPFAALIETYLTKWAQDGQNRVKGNPV